MMSYRLWRLFAVQGGLTLALGIAALAVPVLGTRGLLTALGVYAVAGAVPLLYAFVHGRTGRAGALIVLAGVGLAFGELMFSGASSTTLRLAVMGWSFLSGCGGLAFAIRFPEGRDATLIIVASVAGLVFPFTLLMPEWKGMLAGTIGVFGLFCGTLLLALGLRLRHAGSTP